jgi:streptogramin lyase
MALVPALLSANVMAVNITEYPAPVIAAPNGAGPLSITVGADGNLWFTESMGDSIGRIDPSGNTTTFLLPGPYPPGIYGPTWITSGPNGNLWFTDGTNNRIDSITPSGLFTTFGIPTVNAGPYGITTGGDGNVWFAEKTSSKIGKLTPAGEFTEYPVVFYPQSIVAGQDGNLWFTEFGVTCGVDICSADNATIGRMTPAGTLTEFPVPTANSFLGDIAAGADGNLWFTENQGSLVDGQPAGGKIGRITTAGAVSEYATPTTASVPTGIALGTDGNLWFTESATNNIGRITGAGAITEYPIPTANSGATGITAGPNGTIWFAETLANQIGTFSLASAPIKLDGYMSGNWFDPAQSGQGFQLEFTDEGNTAVAIWFTFAPDGSGQNWIYAQGSYDNTTNSVTLPATLVTGTKFPPNFNANDVTKTPWGTITFSFSDCNNGTASWNSTLAGYGSGTLPIARLTHIKGLACP